MSKPDARDILKLYEEAKQLRSRHEPDFRMASAYCLPRHYLSWQNTDKAESSTRSDTSRIAYDNTGVRSVPKFVAILHRLATPEGMKWHKLAASDTSLMKKYVVRNYFDTLTNKLFKMRYSPRARFGQSASELYTSLGVYGTAPMTIMQRKSSIVDRRGGLSYKSWPLRDVFLLVDDEGNVSVIFRRFFLNARQYRMKFGDDLEKAPPSVKMELGKATPSETNMFEFVHYVALRNDYDEKALNYRRHPYTSCYISVKDGCYVGDESGYASLPYLTPRTFTEPGDVYGYSPAMQALPALGGVSAMKKTILKAGHKQVAPPLLANDDGALSGRVDLRPGRVTYGGINSAGHRLVQPIETGNIQVGEVLLQDERRDIEDSFLVTLFQILTESPEMTATEVMERVAEKAALLAPTMGRMQSEFLGPCIEREINVLAEMGELPEMPPELVEAKGEYNTVYTSPLAKSMYAEETSGFMRVLETTLNLVQATQDQGLLDHFNFEEAIPEMADHMNVPVRWLNDIKTIEAKRSARQEQQADQGMMEQAPAIASVVGAAMKAGKGNVKGVAS